MIKTMMQASLPGIGTSICPEFNINYPRRYAYFFYTRGDVSVMNARKIAVAGLMGGTILFVLLFGLDLIMNRFIEYDMGKFDGMRQMNDPLMLLFFLYPYVVAFAAAYAYDTVHPSLAGSGWHKGVSFGIFLIILVAIPSDFAMVTSLDLPVTFFISNLIWAIVGFLLAGTIFSRIWSS